LNRNTLLQHFQHFLTSKIPTYKVFYKEHSVQWKCHKLPSSGKARRLIKHELKETKKPILFVTRIET